MKKNQKLKIVFFGTPKFARVILEKLIQTKYKPILVVTAPDAQARRKQKITSPPVKALAQDHKISVVQPQKISTWTVPVDIDLIIVVAYGQILPKKILDLPKYGALNVHPSLLPRWRGAAPVQYAILEGDAETGATIIKMDEKMDHGPIVANVKYQMTNAKTAETLVIELAELAGNLLGETIPKWIAGEIKPIPQIEEDATYSKIIMKSDGHINWAKDACEIERQIRAFAPWPGSFTFWKNKRIEIISGYPLELSGLKEMLPGQTFLTKDGDLAVQTGKGFFAIKRLKIEGKNNMTIKEFLNGYASIIGTTLC